MVDPIIIGLATQGGYAVLSSVTTDSSYTAFSTSTDSSGNVVYKTEYPSKIYVSLVPNSGYNAGKITINGVEKDSATVNSDLVDGMVISATDATAIPFKSFTDVTLSLYHEVYNP